MTPGELRLSLEASAAARTAIPLPGNLKDWVPGVRCASTARRPAPLSRTDDGTLWLALSPGTSRVEMTGPLSARETIQIALPLKPRFVTARVRGWTLDGLHEDGAADESLKLSRAGGAGRAARRAERMTRLRRYRWRLSCASRARCTWV